MAEGELMTLGELYSWGQEELQKNSVADAQLDAWYLLEYVSGVSRAMYYAYPEKELAEADAEPYPEESGAHSASAPDWKPGVHGS